MVWEKSKINTEETTLSSKRDCVTLFFGDIGLYCFQSEASKRLFVMWVGGYVCSEYLFYEDNATYHTLDETLTLLRGDVN